METRILRDVNFGGNIGVLSKGAIVDITDVIMNNKCKSGIACSCTLISVNSGSFSVIMDLIFIIDDADFITNIKYVLEKKDPKAKSMLKNKLNAIRYGL